jgi:hypothetical protein
MQWPGSTIIPFFPDARATQAGAFPAVHLPVVLLMNGN